MSFRHSLSWWPSLAASSAALFSLRCGLRAAPCRVLVSWSTLCKPYGLPALNGQAVDPCANGLLDRLATHERNVRLLGCLQRGAGTLALFRWSVVADRDAARVSLLSATAFSPLLFLPATSGLAAGVIAPVVLRHCAAEVAPFGVVVSHEDF
jgi:hypothetical protein